jgi:hypothetical protein
MWVGTTNEGNWWAFVVIAFVKHRSIHFVSSDCCHVIGITCAWSGIHRIQEVLQGRKREHDSSWISLRFRNGELDFVFVVRIAEAVDETGITSAHVFRLFPLLLPMISYYTLPLHLRFPSLLLQFDCAFIASCSIHFLYHFRTLSPFQFYFICFAPLIAHILPPIHQICSFSLRFTSLHLPSLSIPIPMIFTSFPH